MEGIRFGTVSEYAGIMCLLVALCMSVYISDVLDRGWLVSGCQIKQGLVDVVRGLFICWVLVSVAFEVGLGGELRYHSRENHQQEFGFCL